jgi:MFS family permease
MSSPVKDESTMNRTGAGYALCILFAINAINFFDRQIGGVLAEPVRKEWGLTDTQVGWLATAFTLLYAVVGVPLGRLADRSNRSRILAVGVFFWSLMTAASGLTRNFWQLFVVRLGVGVGEATCAPASASLIGDLYPPQQRAKAMSFFMMGLPIGLALSYLVSSQMSGDLSETQKNAHFDHRRHGLYRRGGRACTDRSWKHWHHTF